MKQLTTILAFATLSMSVAAVNPADFPELEPGKEYQMELKKPFEGKYTAKENAVLIEYAPVAAWTLQDDELKQITEADGYVYAGFINGKQAYQFSVKAGETYYFYENFIINAGIFMFELNPEAELVSSKPEIGITYDPAAYSYIEYTFNQNLNIGKVTISIKDLSADVDFYKNGSTISVDVNPILRQWYNEDKISAGLPLQIHLKNVTDGFGHEVNDLTYEYLTANKPVEMKNAELPVLLRSWYDEGEDAPKAIFTFTGPMAENPSIELCYAPVELGYEYRETMDAKVEGNTITVDFGGKRRTSAEMSTSGRQDANIFLLLQGLKDASGQMVWSDAQGTIGSYMYEIPFAEIPRLSITSEFTPSLGGSLENAKVVKIYFTCADHLTYSGVAFSSGEEKVIVGKDEITVDQISDSEVELTVPIPAGWNTKKDVIISLDGLTADDGYDHSSDISAKFNGFTLLFCSVKDGARLKSLTEGTVIKVETNLSEDTKLSFEIADVLAPVEMNAQGDGVYTMTMPETIIFDVDKTYTVNFIADGEGVESLTIIGDTAPYEFSDIVLESVNPESGAQLADGTGIKLRFSGLVFIEATEESSKFTATPGGNDDSGYDYEWEIKFADYDAENLTLAFSAKDMDNKVIEGNKGTDAASYFLFVYNSDDSSISEIATEESTEIYDLQGRRVLSPGHGLYIRNHKVIRL